MKKREQNIDEMVALIDRLMEEGSMHVRVTAEDAEGTQVHTQNTNECALGACMQPTEKQELSDTKKKGGQ